MWKLENMGNKPKNDNHSDNQQQISFFDVKELYDAAYAEKAKARQNEREFQILLRQAELLAHAYRMQLGALKPFAYVRQHAEAA